MNNQFEVKNKNGNNSRNQIRIYQAIQNTNILLIIISVLLIIQVGFNLVNEVRIQKVHRTFRDIDTIMQNLGDN